MQFLISHNFPEIPKGRPESKGRKSTQLYAHIAIEENFQERNKKMKIIKVAANSSQMSLPWCDIFSKEGSTKMALEQLSNSENHTPTR